ncbi:MAG: universal stress protein [Flavisolibacter sp.]|nr:universal stress protein [Flavisolibacter sp.]
MKILVPTDFSAHAKVAARYAIGFARDVQASLIFIHVAYVPGPPKARVASEMLGRAIYTADKEYMKQLVNEMKAESVPIDYSVVQGETVGDVIKMFVNENAIDLVIMGSKGASELRKMFMGTNAVAVINRSSVPVIVVPERAIYAGIHHIVYATDFKNLQNEIAHVLPLMKLFNAALTIIHICEPETAGQATQQKKLSHLIEELDYPKTESKMIMDDNAIHAIEKYGYEAKADLLLLFTHKMNFWRQFYERSITRQLAFHNRLPLYVLNNR